jgi:ABC-type antimicrobial peptide transport system permease subunit
VGVVADVRYQSLREPADETIYFDARNWSWVDFEVDVLVRSAGAPTSLVEPIRGELTALDAEIPLAEIRLMTAYVDDGTAENRFALSLIGVFAAVAAALALIGLYGVLSSAVAERTREIGIRVALGSSKQQVLRLVVMSGLKLAAVGLALGLAGAFLLTRFLASFLYDVAATDVVTFTQVSVTMLVVAGLASYLPARRATRLDPMAVLRSD